MKLQERAKVVETKQLFAKATKEVQEQAKKLAEQKAMNLVKHDLQLAQETIMQQIQIYQQSKLSQVNSVLQ